MKILEITGKTVNDAIENGLRELRLKREQIDHEVLDQGKQGIFGRFGARPAKVKIIVKNNYEALAKTFLRDVLDNMGIKCEIHIKDEKDALRVNLVGPKMGILIGYRGETLDSLQYLLSLVVNKENKDSEYKRVILDTENYRQKREETLVRLANRLAYKVKRYGKSVTLEPMNPYERRVIHAALQNHPFVATHSEGDEPYRKIVIELKKNV
jgi:spoIIIJ-associated protein